MVTGWPNLSNPTDSVFFLIIGISLALLFITSGTMVYFVIRYNRKRHPRPENITGNTALEIIWTIIPTILVLAIFWAGWKGFVFKRTVPKDAMLVKVTARQWSWDFKYENGIESQVLKVPIGRPVKLSLTSTDVLHSLFIPAYRVKEDCVPGMETYLWFQPDQEGSFDLFCTEYCGVGHSAMITKVEVVPQEEFEKWYQARGISLAEAAQRPVDRKKGALDIVTLLKDKGCLGCHTIDGSPKLGPTLKGLYTREVTVITQGKEHKIVADEPYIRRSIKEPRADIVKGFPPVMPALPLSDHEIDAIVEYLKTLR